MERLTRRHADGELFRPLYIIDGRKEYVNETDILEKLAEYEDLEEQGRLLKLPCAVGDTVYRICPKCNDSHDGSCKNCAWENSCSNRGCTVYGGWKDGQYPMGECTIVPYKVSWNYIPNLLENIGKRVFITREEAEAALRELRTPNRL